MSGIRNFDIVCLSQIKLKVASEPPAMTRRAVSASKRGKAMRAKRQERATISRGIRLRIFSSSKLFCVIANEVKQSHHGVIARNEVTWQPHHGVITSGAK